MALLETMPLPFVVCELAHAISEEVLTWNPIQNNSLGGKHRIVQLIGTES